jgi:hypothetical protein
MCHCNVPAGTSYWFFDHSKCSCSSLMEHTKGWRYTGITHWLIYTRSCQSICDHFGPLRHQYVSYSEDAGPFHTILPVLFFFLANPNDFTGVPRRSRNAIPHERVRSLPSAEPKYSRTISSSVRVVRHDRSPYFTYGTIKVEQK